MESDGATRRQNDEAAKARALEAKARTSDHGEPDTLTPPLSLTGQRGLADAPAPPLAMEGTTGCGPRLADAQARTPTFEPRTRLSDADALALFAECSIHELGRQAFDVASRLHPEPYRTYVVDRNINYANWCTAKCAFCNFKADPPGTKHGRKDLPGGYVLSLDEVARKIQELIDIGGTQILMQGGLVPPEILGFDWYLDLLRFIRRQFPRVHVHAFSPPEIFAFHKIFGMSIRDVLLRLREAGLDSIPGGGAEILVDRVRDRISVGKTRTDEYLEVMRQAHRIGMKTSITMMFGHIETIAERIEHLRRVRDLQDETGGFTAFIGWTFQPENTPLGRVRQMPVEAPARQGPGRRQGVDVRLDSPPRRDGTHAAADAPVACAPGPDPRRAGDVEDAPRLPQAPDGRHLCLAGAHEYLKTLALARLYLDNIPNVQASWVTQGPKIGQLALFFGANDMGSVMMEENVVSAAGTTYRLTEPEIRRLIADAGWQPRRRNFYYEPIE